MYRKITDFLQDWKREAQSTEKMLSRLTDASLEQSVNPEGRSLGRLAWHITQTLTEMPLRAGLLDADTLEHQPQPDTAGILAAYQQAAASLAEHVQARWKDEDLTDKVPMYGEEWKKGQVLSILIAHQTHHRGQMTVLMRQAGLTVPGVFGPSKEEWLAYGMQPLP